MTHPLLWLSVLLLVLGGACRDEGPPERTEIAVEVQDVAVDPLGNPVILLKERDGPRRLPIWIGIAEARSIAAELEEVVPPRPNTHDLAKRLLDELGGRVERVVVTELRDRTYYGLIVMAGPAGAREVDSRPSDAIALALRVGAPIYVEETLLEEEGDEEADDVVEPPGREVHQRLPGNFPGSTRAAARLTPRALRPGNARELPTARPPEDKSRLFFVVYIDKARHRWQHRPVLASLGGPAPGIATTKEAGGDR